IMASKQKLTIVAIGPLTNVAMLVQKYPEVVERIE
ncbi:MAG: Inosine-uridine preferring nucleoside hydrolase, partial [Bacilli bacterium]|nr:Inosine-uridine preferring nucleoside hydrolase [Bacilli bacterium]